jgi:lysophospholipid acyltransferase
MANHAVQNPNMPKRLYDAVGTLTTILIVNFTVIPFILLDVHSSLMGWRLTHYYGHFMVGAPLLIFWLGGKKWLVGLQKERVKKLSSETGQVVSQPSTPPTPGPHVVPPLHQLSDRVTIS